MFIYYRMSHCLYVNSGTIELSKALHGSYIILEFYTIYMLVLDCHIVL